MLKLTHEQYLEVQQNQPPLGGCVLKQFKSITRTNHTAQPPLGGCVLKLEFKAGDEIGECQPPLGGCVLKQYLFLRLRAKRHQPPLGGCVLKQGEYTPEQAKADPAAFRRLCVETRPRSLHRSPLRPSRL